MGIFKVEDSDHMHMIPLINVTQSGIRIRFCLYRLVTLLKAEGSINFPEFCDEEGYMISASAIEILFHPILEEIQEHRDSSLSDSVLSSIDNNYHYPYHRYFLRGEDNQVLENGLYNLVINFVHEWSEFEGSKGKQPGLNMLEHFAEVANTRYLQMRFVKIL